MYDWLEAVDWSFLQIWLESKVQWQAWLPVHAILIDVYTLNVRFRFDDCLAQMLQYGRSSKVNVLSSYVFTSNVNCLFILSGGVPQMLQ